MATGPQLDTSVSLTSTSGSITVGNNPRRVLVYWGPTGVGGGNAPVYPVMTFDGNNLSFPIVPQYYSPFNLYSPAFGYLVAPSVGTYTITTNTTTSGFAVFYDVDQTITIGATGGGSSQNATPQSQGMTTTSDYSVVLKGVAGSASLGQIFSEGAGESNLWLTLNGGTSFIPRGGFKPTTSAGSQTLQTTWTGGGSAGVVFQLVELLWGGNLSSGVSATTANSASRTQSASRLGVFLRTTSATVSNAAGRFATPATQFLRTVAVTTANAASRLASVSYSIKYGWHFLAKNVISWVEGSKHNASPSNPAKSSSSWSNTSKS